MSTMIGRLFRITNKTCPLDGEPNPMAGLTVQVLGSGGHVGDFSGAVQITPPELLERIRSQHDGEPPAWMKIDTILRMYYGLCDNSDKARELALAMTETDEGSYCFMKNDIEPISDDKKCPVCRNNPGTIIADQGNWSKIGQDISELIDKDYPRHEHSRPSERLVSYRLWILLGRAGQPAGHVEVLPDGLHAQGRPVYQQCHQRADRKETRSCATAGKIRCSSLDSGSQDRHLPEGPVC